MTRVDPDDDRLNRYVARYYRYDPDRHQRRHVVEAAFDNAEEMHAWMDERTTARAREEAGCREPIEHYTGLHLEPGYTERARQQRLGWRRPGRGLRPEP